MRSAERTIVNEQASKLKQFERLSELTTAHSRLFNSSALPSYRAVAGPHLLARLRAMYY